MSFASRSSLGRAIALLIISIASMAHADDRSSAEPERALRVALETLEAMERRALELSSNADDLVALLGIPGHAQAERVAAAADRLLEAVMASADALTPALRALPPSTLNNPWSDDLADTVARAEDALAMLIPLRAARATLVHAALSDDPARREELAAVAEATLRSIVPAASWVEAERGFLMAVAMAALGNGSTALEQLLDARGALRADPRLADPALRLTLQIAGASVLATLAEAGPDAAGRALERLADRQPFAPPPTPAGGNADPLSRLLLADLNARIELSRLEPAGGMMRAAPDFRRRVLQSIADGYARMLDEPGLSEHRESLRALAHRRLARLVPESLDPDTLPVLVAVARIARLEEIHAIASADPHTEAGRIGLISREIVEQLRVLLKRDDADARSIRADVLFDLAAAEQRVGEHASAAGRLLAFVRARPEDERAAAAIPRAMALAEQAGDRHLALEAGWFAHRAPFEIPGRDAIRLRLIGLLIDAHAYRDPLDPVHFDLRGFFAGLLIDADRVARDIDRQGPGGLALRELLVSGDAWALALAERFPEQLTDLQLSATMLADQAERRATDLLTFQPGAGQRGLPPIARARVLAHRARAWLLLSRPLDAVTDIELALVLLSQLDDASDALAEESHDDLSALLVRAAAEARQHDHAGAAFAGALGRSMRRTQLADRLLETLIQLEQRTRALLDSIDRLFPADQIQPIDSTTRDMLSWLPDRTGFLVDAASTLRPEALGWHQTLRYQHARACVLGARHADAVAALDLLHRDGHQSVATLRLLGEARLLAGDDAGSFAAYRAIVSALDATAEHDAELWRAWARMVEILERQAGIEESGRRLASVQRQIRRLRLRDGYHSCAPSRHKIEAVAERLGVDLPAGTGGPEPSNTR